MSPDAVSTTGPTPARGSEYKTTVVAIVTAVTMVLEILAGWWFNSMALLADGWHMGTHAAAIGLSAMAYVAARRYADDPRFAFGTWKIEVLAAFASAMFLMVIAVLMVYASVERLLDPRPIQYIEAIAVTVLGLIVNIGCALVLGAHSHGPEGHGHMHGHSHGPGHPHAHGPGEDEHPHGHSHAEAHADLNLRSAYLHVVADAATSALAIVALLGGMFFAWGWLDPAMALVGAAMVGRWAWGLIGLTGRALLDREMDHPLAGQIRAVVPTLSPDPVSVRLMGLKVWRVGRTDFACIVKLVSHDPSVTVHSVKRRLRQLSNLKDITVEVEHMEKHE